MAPRMLTVYFDQFNPNSEKSKGARRSLAGLDYSPLPRVTGKSLVLALFVSMGGLM
jgi:SP family sugar:H+ symporter-like MFS transporter